MVPVDKSGVERLFGTCLLGEDKHDNRDGWGVAVVDH